MDDLERQVRLMLIHTPLSENLRGLLNAVVAALADIREMGVQRDVLSAGVEDLANELEAAQDEMLAWKDAVIDACVTAWIFTADHETDPRKAVSDLLASAQMPIDESTRAAEARATRLLMAVAAAYEGLEVPTDLSEHGLVVRARYYRSGLNTWPGPSVR